MRGQCALSWHLLVCGHRINEVTTATLDPLPHGSTTEVETDHPRYLVVRPYGYSHTAVPDRTRTTRNSQLRFPRRRAGGQSATQLRCSGCALDADCPGTAGACLRPASAYILLASDAIDSGSRREAGDTARTKQPRYECDPCGRWRWPNAPAGADRQGRSRSCGRVSPEMRPGPSR